MRGESSEDFSSFSVATAAACFARASPDLRMQRRLVENRPYSKAPADDGFSF